jgi:hypothetical protein
VTKYDSHINEALGNIGKKSDFSQKEKNEKKLHIEEEQDNVLFNESLKDLIDRKSIDAIDTINVIRRFVYVCVYICICIYVFIYIYKCAHTYMFIYMCICTYTNIYIGFFICSNSPFKRK